MGKFLQIRVSAVTYDASKVAAAYPRLCALAWPVEASAPAGSRGVLELAAALADRVRLGEPFPAREAVLGGLKPVLAARDGVENALANRDPQQADHFSYALEDALAELEKLAPPANPE